jgi:DNA-directed RNA polymerase specialized sigma24 family protein
LALNERAFASLLSVLGPDSTAAGERYELLRQRLLYFFGVRHAPHAEEQVDEVMDRLARRLAEGATVSPSVEAFALGVARNVARESWKRPRGVALPIHLTERDSGGDVADAMRCLEECLEALDAQSRRSILRFYRGDGAEKIRERQALAEELGVDANALRVRMHRIRLRLEKCVEECRKCNESTKGAIQ